MQGNQWQPSDVQAALDYYEGEKFLGGSTEMPYEAEFVTNPLSVYEGGPEDSRCVGGHPGKGGAPRGGGGGIGERGRGCAWGEGFVTNPLSVYEGGPEDSRCVSVLAAGGGG